jgi:hypothetical protein
VVQSSLQKFLEIVAATTGQSKDSLAGVVFDLGK